MRNAADPVNLSELATAGLFSLDDTRLAARLDAAIISQGEIQTALNFILRQFLEIFSVAFGVWRLAILSAAPTLSPQPYDARSAR
jgi:hypothetical protein